METDPFVAWLEAARHADAFREEVGQMVRDGRKPSADLLVRLAKLEDEVLDLQKGITAAIQPPRTLH